MQPLMLCIVRYLTGIFLGLYTSCGAAILYVPSDYQSIQLAMDESATGDTILVSPGIYHEFLTGPAHTFTLSGTYSPDSSLPEMWTVLDPIPLPDADTPSALVLGSDTATIEDFVFFNRPEMRQVDWPTRSGGIRNETTLLTLSACRFDSVSSAIDHGDEIDLSRTVFSACTWHCVWPNTGGRLKVRDCTFDGRGQVLVLGYDSSIVESCVFACNPTGHSLGLFGRSVRLSGCEFVDCIGGLSTVYVWPRGDFVIDHCVFNGIHRVPVILEVNVVCDEGEPIPIVIRDCVFDTFDNAGLPSGITAIQLRCQQGDGPVGSVLSNEFRNGASARAGIAIDVSGSASLDGNIFENLLPVDRADVYVSEITSSGTVTARDNHFLLPGLAAERSGSLFDARWNWWGDSTGPFHPSLNPGGLGTEVGNGVLFDPWLTAPPDSADTSSFAEEQSPVIPSSYSLSAFPNPFNAVTTLTIEVARAGGYEIRVYDVTGREVAKVFEGRLAGSHELTIDASEFSSGIYFAGLSDNSGELAATKLVLLK